MFKINGGGTAFDQWDLDKQVTEEHMNVGDKVRFRNASGEVHVMYAYDMDGAVVVNVPNKLLQTAGVIVVDLLGNPTCRTMINVKAQAKPDNYVYVESDSYKPGDVNARLDKLSEEIHGVPVNFEWDGDLNNPIYNSENGFYFITDAITDFSQLASFSADLTWSKVGETYKNVTINYNNPIDWQGMKVVEVGHTTESQAYIFAGLLLIPDNFTNQEGAPMKAGLYGMLDGTVFISALRGNVYKTIPEESLPSTIPVIQTATVGQTIAVKAVDENGKPTEWEAVDAASSGGGVVTYYTFIDKILYHDQQFTKKVTYDEGREAMRNGLIRVSLGPTQDTIVIPALVKDSLTWITVRGADGTEYYAGEHPGAGDT